MVVRVYLSCSVRLKYKITIDREPIIEQQGMKTKQLRLPVNCNTFIECYKLVIVI